jgi:hypothetical protein
MKKSNLKRAMVATSLSCILVACGGGGDGGTPGASAVAAPGATSTSSSGSTTTTAADSSASTAVVGTGALRMALTDAPACGFDKVYITVERVRVHQSASASDSDAGWSDIVLDPAKRIDLLSLTNGILTELGQTALPAGKYTQLRLVLAANGNVAPFANSAIPTGSKDEVPLTTPSATDAGLKINVDLTVATGKTADFVLDFNACQSIVSAGQSGKYLLKPVLSLAARS